MGKCNIFILRCVLLMVCCVYVQRATFNILFDVTLSSVRSRLIRSIFAIYIFDQSLETAENSLYNHCLCIRP